MKRSLLLLTALFLVSAIVYGATYQPDNVSITGACDWMVYDNSEYLGEIIRTIPLVAPGTNNAYLGMAWANGYLIVLKNINTPQSSCFFIINPANGAVLDTVPMPFTGWVMGAAFDGNYLWVVKWYTTNVIYRLDLNGAIISQFTPSTGSYSCRGIAVEGDYLWVGANYSSNNTKLYKMTYTGTIVSEYTTGSVVGWYMDGELDYNAGSGSNLFFVDNIGNAVKRLNVTAAGVSINAQFASPAVSPDIAEGLAFDGEYLWHEGGLSSLGVMWCIDDGLPSTPLDVTVTLTPEITPIVIPANGGSFNFNIAIANLETTPSSFNAWTKITLPSGSQVGPLIGPVNVTLGAGATADRDRTQNIPANAPAGNYTYDGYVGIFPNSIFDEDHFAFTKSAFTDGGLLVSDWFNWGEDFGDLSGFIANDIPEAFALYANYPNPFNPDTHIDFSLPVACKVNLRVFNIMGEEVAVLAEGMMPAGYHSVTFSGDQLSSGIYICYMQAGDFHSVKKMTLLK